jgi:hypothetical protein
MLTTIAGAGWKEAIYEPTPYSISPAFVESGLARRPMSHHAAPRKARRFPNNNQSTVSGSSISIGKMGDDVDLGEE